VGSFAFGGFILQPPSSAGLESLAKAVPTGDRQASRPQFATKPLQILLGPNKQVQNKYIFMPYALKCKSRLHHFCKSRQEHTAEQNHFSVQAPRVILSS
jgi:hypothetical protein